MGSADRLLKAKKLAIIGNANVTCDHSQFVNSCDVVIRINLRKNPSLILGVTGGKTDVLCYTPRAVSLVLQDDEELRFIRGYSAHLSRLWFLRPRRAYWVSRRSLSGFFFRKERLFLDMSRTLIKGLGLGHSTIEYIKMDLFNSTVKKLWDLDPCGMKPSPSAGIMVIERVLENEEYSNFEKYLLGFTFEGWAGHRWDLEKRLVDRYHEKGLLKFLPE